MTGKSKIACGVAAALVALNSTSVVAQTPEPAQVAGFAAGWSTSPVFTIGESFDGYTPPGIPDGMGAFERGGNVLILSNHELSSGSGYQYQLANGAVLTGARVSALTLDKATREVVSFGPAFDTIYNRAGNSVTGPADLDFGGLNRLCSAGSAVRGQAGFVDDIFFTGEETSGGTEFALDVATGELWALPWLGRAAWESVAALEVPGINHTHVAILIGDDRGDAPLLLYVGEKLPGGNFVERNGLSYGRLYMWVADNGDLSPADWNSTGASRHGRFVEVVNYDASMANQEGYDELGFATQANIDGQKADIGAFNFSRPEDLHVNPRRGDQVVFASTGRNTALNQGADLWGTTYLVDVKINPGRIRNDNITAEITILYDGDDSDKRDFGIRSPDNLVWADNGYVYIQEDRSIGGFGADSGQETSIWQLDPQTYEVMRIAQVDRSAIPAGQTDFAPADLGNWESSGVIDVTEEFDAEGTLLFFNVQAHSLNGGAIAAEGLVQGGQYLFLGSDEAGINPGKGRRK